MNLAKICTLLYIIYCINTINVNEPQELNFQERGIYYADEDHVCRGTESDQIILKINVDGK
jgi:hypothetical protein